MEGRFSACQFVLLGDELLENIRLDPPGAAVTDSQRGQLTRADQGVHISYIHAQQFGRLGNGDESLKSELINQFIHPSRIRIRSMLQAA